MVFYFTVNFLSFTDVKVSLTRFFCFKQKYRVTFVQVISLLRRKQNKETETLLKTENMKTTVKHLTAGTFIALLLLVGIDNAKGTEAKASSRENIENTLQVEKWMTDEFVWNTNSTNISNFSIETETSMELENWMTSEKTWNLNNNFVEETETDMELENWMINEETWNLNQINNEQELTVENWMINNNIWN